MNEGFSGLDRKELYVDARDLQSTIDETTLTTEQYNNLLTTRGNEKLSEKQAILLLDGDVNINSELYKYGTDYNLGDKVSVYSERFRVSTVKTLTEIPCFLHFCECFYGRYFESFTINRNCVANVVICSVLVEFGVDVHIAV